MADGPGQEVQGIALGLTLDTTGWSAGIQRAKAELAGLTASAKGVTIGGGAGGGTGGRRSGGGAQVVEPTVSPGFQVSRGAVRDLRVDINQHLRTMAGQGEAVQVPITLSRVNFGALRSQITQGIGEVPIKVRVDPSSLRGQASLIAAIMSTATGETMGKATASIQTAAASRSVPIPKRAMGGPVRGYSGGGPTYAQWAQARHVSMGGAGKLKITPAEEATAQRGIQNVKHLIALSQRNDPQLAQAGRGWYTEQAQIHDFAGRAKTLGVSLKQLVDTIAILSSGAQWYANKADAFTAKGVRSPVAGPNITAAESLIRHVTKGSPVASSAVVTGEMINDVKRYFGGAQMNAANFGPKRSQFAEAFRNPNAFPIDRWQGRATTLGERHGNIYGAGMSAGPELERMMAQAVKGRDWTSADAPGPAHRRASVYAVEQAAQQLGIEPRGVQAESWTEIKRLEGVGNKLFRLDKATGLALPRKAQGGRVKAGGLPRGYSMEFHGRTGEPGHYLGSPEDVVAGWNPQAEQAQWGYTMPRVSNYGQLQKPNMPKSGAGWPGAFSATVRDRYGAQVAHAPFNTMRDEQGRVQLEPQITYVDPAHRGKGLANAMYVRAEKWSGGTMVPGRSQTDAGAALWKQPDRPFGRGYERPEGLPKRYRGGPTLSDTFPNARVDLSGFERSQRLAIGKQALHLGQEYPHTAKHVQLIEGVKARELAMRGGGGDSIGYTERGNVDWLGSRIMLNTDFKEPWIREAGGVSRSWPDVLTHEFGHAHSLANSSPRNYAPRAASPYGQRMLKAIKSPSPYGDSDLEEKYAELFVERDRYRSRHNLYSELLGTDKKRYRGGPTLRDVYPRTSIDLHHYSRASRLMIGKELLGLGQDYPHVADEMETIHSATPRFFDQKFIAYGKNMGDNIAGETSRMRGGRGSRMLFNAGMGDADVAGLGTLSKSIKDMVTHEFGHAIDQSFGHLSHNGGSADLFSSMNAASGYGEVNPDEHFAELFLQHRRDGNPTTGGWFDALSTLSHRRMNEGGGGLLGRLRRRAMGGPTDIIAGELGRELFVPASMSGMIPPDVMGQLPKRAAGGPIEIPPGPLVWTPPEDGWIVPNHLMNKVPRYAAGGPFSSYGDPDDLTDQGLKKDSSGRYQRVSGRGGYASAARVAAARANRMKVLRQAARDDLYEGLRQIRSSHDELSALPHGSINVEDRLAAGEATAQRTAVRGLTGRSALGGAFASILGGGRKRRENQIRAQVYGQEYREFLPPGVKPGSEDPIDLFSGNVRKAGENVEALTKALDFSIKGFGANSNEVKNITKELVKQKKAFADNTEALQTAHELNVKHQDALGKSEGGLFGNFAATTLAGVAFTFGTQVVDSAVGLMSKAIAPEVDKAFGFTPTSQRVTGQLAQQLPQAGTQQTLFGQTGIGAGLPANVVDYLQSQLGGSVYAKGGANAAGQAGDLFRAAIGAANGAQTGLLGGYGGIGGGPAFAEQLGGGKGFAETIASQFSDATGQTPPRPGAAGFFGGLVDNLGKGADLVGTGFNSLFDNGASARQKYVQSQGGLGVSRVVTIDPKSVGIVADTFNQAAQRAATREGQGATQLKSTSSIIGTGPGALDRANDLVKAYRDLDDNTKGILDAGYAFVDASGKILSTQEQVNKAYAQSAEGFTLPDPAVFAKASAQALTGGEQSIGLRGGIERSTLIPGQLGQQLAASPQLAATTGIAKGFKSTLADLGQTQKLQDSVQQDAEAGLKAQQALILDNLGLAKSTEFGTYMDQVKDYGTQIAGLQTTLANKQAAVGAASYANSIRLINRSLADARGLVSGRGSSLGAIERKQFDVGRESQQLQFELQQRQLNFQTAVAGFQAPGITGQERAARIAEAKLEASYGQRQLNLGRQGFGLEGQAFNVQASRQVVDLQHQKSLLTAQYGLEQEQLAVQKRIAALSAKQAQSQSKALSIFNEATGVFDGRLGTASAYVAQFGGTLAAAMKAVRIALGLPTTSSGSGSSTQGGGNRPKSSDKGHATGIVGYTTGATDMLVGEAQSETVAVLRNPRKVRTDAYAPAGGGGGGWGGGGSAPVIQISISGNSFGGGDQGSPQAIARQLADEIENRLGMKARLFSRASAG